jgi:hypothetical protein
MKCHWNPSEVINDNCRARTMKIRNAYKSLGGKNEGKTPPERVRYTWENYIKINLQEIEY